eukprot:PhM_4_TR16553/c0_g1_i1/m.101292
MDAFISQCTGKHVVLAGCGGGYDVMGTALFFNSVAAVARRVTVVNLSFTSTSLLDDKATPSNHSCSIQRLHEHAWRVAALDSNSNNTTTKEKKEDLYFPELQLSRGIGGHPVHVLHNRCRIKDMVGAYAAIIGTSDAAEVILLLDGGCDVLLTGRESGLATPIEDMMHLKTVFSLPSPSVSVAAANKAIYVAAIGANVDCGHGVVLSELQARLGDLRRRGVVLHEEKLDLKTSGTGILDAAFYHNIVMQSCPINTMVQTLVCAALEGHRDYYTPPHIKPRFRQNKVPIMDLTCTFFLFDGQTIFDEVLYMPGITEECGSRDISYVLEEFKQRLAKKGL